MKLLLLANIIFLASVANACGPIFRAVFFPPPPPPPTYYTCNRVSNGPPCTGIGSTLDTAADKGCTCKSGAVNQAACPMDQTYYFVYNGAQYCYDTNYNGYVSCVCKAPGPVTTWTPSLQYYQVAVNSNGGISYPYGYPGFYGKKKK